MFEVIIAEFWGSDRAEVVRELTSPMLDRNMHRDGKVALYIAIKAGAVGDNVGFILESFQLESLVEFLRNQAYIRETLEKELSRHQEVTDPDGEPISGDVWASARVTTLKLRSWDLRTPRAIRQLENAGRTLEEIEELLPAPEDPRTRTVFVVALECDWSLDDDVEATFRDGKFVDFD